MLLHPHIRIAKHDGIVNSLQARKREAHRVGATLDIEVKCEPTDESDLRCAQRAQPQPTAFQRPQLRRREGRRQIADDRIPPTGAEIDMRVERSRQPDDLSQALGPFSHRHRGNVPGIRIPLHQHTYGADALHVVIVSRGHRTHDFAERTRLARDRWNLLFRQRRVEWDALRHDGHARLRGDLVQRVAEVGELRLAQEDDRLRRSG